MTWLLVALGGALGSVARYAVSGLMAVAVPGRFPWGTLTVNLVGCLAIGMLAGWLERAAVWSTDARAFVFAGLLGGFTTFSSFGLETVLLLKTGHVTTALLYVAASVAAGLLLAGGGFWWLQTTWGYPPPLNRKPHRPVPATVHGQSRRWYLYRSCN